MPVSSPEENHVFIVRADAFETWTRRQLADTYRQVLTERLPDELASLVLQFPEAGKQQD